MNKPLEDPEAVKRMLGDSAYVCNEKGPPMKITKVDPMETQGKFSNKYRGAAKPWKPKSRKS